MRAFHQRMVLEHHFQKAFARNALQCGLKGKNKWMSHHVPRMFHHQNRDCLHKGSLGTWLDDYFEGHPHCLELKWIPMCLETASPCIHVKGCATLFLKKWRQLDTGFHVQTCVSMSTWKLGCNLLSNLWHFKSKQLDFWSIGVRNQDCLIKLICFKLKNENLLCTFQLICSPMKNETWRCTMNLILLV